MNNSLLVEFIQEIVVVSIQRSELSNVLTIHITETYRKTTYDGGGAMMELLKCKLCYTILDYILCYDILYNTILYNAILYTVYSILYFVHFET